MRKTKLNTLGKKNRIMETNNKYIILWNELLGKGSSCDVYKCKDVSDNYYAIKIISKKIITPKMQKMLSNEISIFSSYISL